MNKHVRHWVKRQASERDIVLEEGPIRFAARITLGVVAAAELATGSAHLLLYAFDLLPYPLFPALLVGSGLAFIISAAVSFMTLVTIGRAIQDLAINRNEFQRLSVTDPLSGLSNRRAFFEALKHTKSGAVILFDIDHFKTINDRFGHDVGDDTIRSVGGAIRTALEGTPASIARIGGEEFGIILPDQTVEAAYATAIGIQNSLAAEPILTADSVIPLTISGGVGACLTGRSIEDIYRSCDEALYAAKREGRNRVVRERTINGAPSALTKPSTRLAA